MGGDAFVALYHDIDQYITQKDVVALRRFVLQSRYQISIGSTWSNEMPVNVEKIMNQADANMNREKNLYYAMTEKMGLDTQTEQCMHSEKEDGTDSHQMMLRRFLSNTYSDISFWGMKIRQAITSLEICNRIFIIYLRICV